MGNYNPRAPYILGEEWVPIRDENVLFSPSVNSYELGHQFTLATDRQAGFARYYVHPSDEGDVEALNRTVGIAIYAAGTADQSGPLRRIQIPVSSVVLSGTSVVQLASSGQEALARPGDLRNIATMTTNTGSTGMMVTFDVNQYLPELNGKRIVDMGIIYSLQKGELPASAVPDTPPIGVTINQGYAITSVSQGYSGHLGMDTAFINPQTLHRFDFGNANRLFSPGSISAETMPWRSTDLARFQVGNANPLTLGLICSSYGTATSFYQWYYLVLDIIYCEEQRLYVGGAREDYQGTLGRDSFVYQANTMPIRSLQSLALNPIIPAGAYDVSVYSIDPGDQGSNLLLTFPELNGLRELYAIPPHPGLRVDIPFPPVDHLGETFTQTASAVLPQISLHATGGAPLTEVHVYGRQGAAQVWGSNTATQEIYDDLLAANATYPQVRFYARRFGDTTVPLALTGTGSLAGSSASVSVAEFDALTDIVDGWKEVTLRFGTPPVMGSLASPEPSWTWSATGEGKGNRWELMAACAPAISGIPGNLFNQVAATQRLGTATYQPPAGDTVELTWMPQGVASPYVSGATADPGCDAVLIFSQDPPTVTGVALSQLTQTVTGIGLDCGSLPCCIPSGIAYQRVTWSATSLPATGFGAYELQRFDTTPGAAFETIMLASSPYVTGFNDYESRVGVNSVYRIRTRNVLNFAGAWSSQVTGAPPEPGVTGGCTDSTGALMFTSNAAQSGIYNAAYVMQWDNADPVQDFKLPEADMLQFQPMYQRDGMVAFHGTERGLEQFTRQLLIQAGAIDPIRLADVKTLRDLAWADLPYICVRDDAGDRWFANVRVPTVSARQARSKYFAQVQITELTSCPYPVDPS